MRFAHLPLISLLAIASAAPTATKSSINPINSLACAVVSDVISALKGYPPYSTFCSSFLGISTRTTSVTVTQSTTLTATATTTTTSTLSTTVTTNVPKTATSTSTSTTFTTSVATITSTITSVSTTTIPVTSTTVSTSIYTSGTVTLTSTVATTTVTADTSTTTVCPDPSNTSAANGGSGDLNRRTVSTTTSVAIPSCVKSWSLPWITTACECLSLPTPVSTSTIYSTSSITQTTTTTVTAKTTTTLTASAYTTVAASTVTVTTSTVASTATASTTIIITSTIQSTVGVVSVTSSGVLATTTTSVTFTTTSTPVATATACPAPSACSNQGLQYAYYPSPFGRNPSNGYANFDPTYFKTQTPQFSGATTNFGFAYGNDASEESFYGSQEASNDRYALNHRGYIYASVTGFYTITLSDVDDIVDVWAGPIAYSGWTRNNALLEAAYFNNVGSGSTSISLTAGTYNAFRFVFGQGDGGASYTLEITDPNGNVILSSGTSDPGYIVQYSCDGTTAPPYQPFGQET